MFELRMNKFFELLILQGLFLTFSQASFLNRIRLARAVLCRRHWALSGAMLTALLKTAVEEIAWEGPPGVSWPKLLERLKESGSKVDEHVRDFAAKVFGGTSNKGITTIAAKCIATSKDDGLRSVTCPLFEV